MIKSYQLGSSKEKPKKVVNVNVGFKHIFLFMLVLFFIVYSIIGLIKPYLVPELEFGCQDGSRELIEEGKEIYCGQNYKEIIDSFPPEKREMVIQKIEGEVPTIY